MKRLLLLSVFCALLGSCDYFKYKEETEEEVVVPDTTYCRIELTKIVIEALDTQSIDEPMAPGLSEVLYLTDTVYKKAYSAELKRYSDASQKYFYANIYTHSTDTQYMVGNPRGHTVDIRVTKSDGQYMGRMQEAVMHPREAEEVAKAVERFALRRSKDNFCRILKVYKP